MINPEISVFPYSKGNTFQDNYIKKLEEFFTVKKIYNSKIFSLLGCANKSTLILDWISPYCIYESNFKSLIKSILFIFQLLILKYFKKIKIIQNIHNFNDHEERSKTIDYFLRIILIFLVDHLRFFSNSSLREYKFYSHNLINKSLVIEHPLYIDNYPKKKESNKIQFLIPGNIRKYKSTLKFINHFKFNKINKLKEGDFVIAGKKHPSVHFNKSFNKYLRIYDKFIPEEEFYNFIRNSNYVLLLHEKITTSGILYLAISLNVPVIAPRKPYFNEILGLDYPFLYDGYEELLSLINKIKDFQISESNFLNNMIKEKYIIIKKIKCENNRFLDFLMDV